MPTTLSPLTTNQAFQGFIADCLEEIDNQNDKAENALRRATIHQLKELSHVRCSFMDDSFSFTTTVGVSAYGADVVADWPRDLLEVYVLYGTSGAETWPVEGPFAVSKMRLISGASASAPRPSVWGWHEGRLLIAPNPSAQAALSIDYRKDGTLDEVSGAAITVSSTTETNGWFGRGINALRTAVLWEYHASFSKDYELATFYEAQKLRAIDTITADYTLTQYRGGQADWHFGSGRDLRWPGRVLPE